MLMIQAAEPLTYLNTFSTSSFINKFKPNSKKMCAVLQNLSWQSVFLFQDSPPEESTKATSRPTKALHLNMNVQSECLHISSALRGLHYLQPDGPSHAFQHWS